MERMPVDLRKAVFIARCKSKRGEFTNKDENRLCELAYKDYPEDYALMEGEVFENTRPFGAGGF